jgi:DNA-binding NtrC family response regulator
MGWHRDCSSIYYLNTTGVSLMSAELTILVADPNPHIRQFLKREFMHAGYKVFEASSYNEIFFRITSGEPPNLIIFDLDLPYNSGLDALKRLQNLVPPIPTIIYSDLTEFEGHPDIRKTEAFVEKNDDPARLFDAVNGVIAKHYQSRMHS